MVTLGNFGVIYSDYLIPLFTQKVLINGNDEEWNFSDGRESCVIQSDKLGITIVVDQNMVNIITNDLYYTFYEEDLKECINTLKEVFSKIYDFSIPKISHMEVSTLKGTLFARIEFISTIDYDIIKNLDNRILEDYNFMYTSLDGVLYPLFGSFSSLKNCYKHNSNLYIKEVFKEDNYDRYYSKILPKEYISFLPVDFGLISSIVKDVRSDNMSLIDVCNKYPDTLSKESLHSLVGSSDGKLSIYDPCVLRTFTSMDNVVIRFITIENLNNYVNN